MTFISSVVVDDISLTKSNEIADPMNDCFCSVREKNSGNTQITENPILKVII